MTSPTPRKRKADALESGEDDAKSPAADSPTLLPAPCLAAILNFLWYTDVRQCMLAGKMMAVEAARHVETLNITKASELVVPAARRFANVSEVNVLCLLEGVTNALSIKATTQLVPFLSSISNLREVFLGGMDIDKVVSGKEVWALCTYDVEECLEPEDHQAIFRSLMEHLCGAFRSRSLRHDLVISGVVEDDQVDCSLWGEREGPERPCRYCRNIMSSFPFQSIFDSFAGVASHCLRKAELLNIFLGRNGSIAALRSNAGRNALIELFWSILPREFGHFHNGRFEKEFAKKLENLGAKPLAKSGFYFYRSIDESDSEFNEVIALVKSSMALRNIINDIPRSKLIRGWPFMPSTERHGKTIYSRQTFDSLVQAGLNLSANDYILVDAQKEHPAVQKKLGIKF